MGRARLSALDGSFLRVETPTAHMHVAWKGIFEPRPGRPVSVDELRRAIAGRLRHAPRFRQRLAFTPGGFAEPVWVDDERFAISEHVVALAEPGQVLARARFDELCDAVLSLPLDRGRALWSLHVAPQLEDGSLGLVMKAHHAMVDGKSAVELALLLLDLSPDLPEAQADHWVAQPAPSSARLALDAMIDTGGESLRAAAGFARAVASPRLAGTLRRAALAVGEDLLRPAPSSYVNVALSPQRILLHHTHEIEPLLAAKTALGVTLNDLALTAVSGALRELALRAASARSRSRRWSRCRPARRRRQPTSATRSRSCSSTCPCRWAARATASTRSGRRRRASRSRIAPPAARRSSARWGRCPGPSGRRRTDGGRTAHLQPDGVQRARAADPGVAAWLRAA